MVFLGIISNVQVFKTRGLWRDLRLAHGRSHSIFEVEFAAVELLLDASLCAVVEEVKESSNDENRCSECKSPGADFCQYMK